MGHAPFLRSEHRDLAARLARGPAAMVEPNDPAARACLAGDPRDPLLARGRRAGGPPPGRPRIGARGADAPHRDGRGDAPRPPRRDGRPRAGPRSPRPAERHDHVHAGAPRRRLLRILDDAPRRRPAQGAARQSLRGLHGGRYRVPRGGLRPDHGGQPDHSCTRRVPEDLVPEVLDWEKASSCMETADTVAVTNCFCRHVAEHLGTRCDSPVETCLSLGRPPATSAARPRQADRNGRRASSSSTPRASTAWCTSPTTCGRRSATSATAASAAATELHSAQVDLPIVQASGFQPAHPPGACTGAAAACARAPCRPSPSWRAAPLHDGGEPHPKQLVSQDRRRPLPGLRGVRHACRTKRSRCDGGPKRRTCR
jgi:hypothetical protein